MIDYSKHTVLIVDDEIEILKSLNRGLHLEPYRKLFASSGAQALEFFAQEDSISVVITDMRMPGMTGLELLKHINEVSPRTVKIVLTGYTQLPQILATVNNVDIFKFMTKPWDLDAELKVYIKEAIAYFEVTNDEAFRLISSEKKGALYNKMLSESYEKVDVVLRLYDELVKALNQHHLFTIQALRGVESLESLNPIIVQMNERVHYLNKIFEMSRYTMKTFGASDVKVAIDSSLSKFDTTNLRVDMHLAEQDIVYYDNFKMISSIAIDIIETLQFNGGGLTRIELRSKAIDDNQFLHVIMESLSNEKLKEVFGHKNKFVEAVVKIVGGRFYEIEMDELIRFELMLPIKKKTIEND